jgi:hypothetical protein
MSTDTKSQFRTRFARAWRAARVGLLTVRYLVTIRRAFPRWLRVLLIIGAVQIPCLPTDELAAVIAVAVLVIRYRPALRVAWRAAQADI